MEVPKYLQVLWAYKWLLLFGLLVSVVAGLLAGFTIRDGELVPRVQAVYRSSTTVMLSSHAPTYFQTEVAPAPVDPLGTTPPPVEVSLPDAAKIYAYLVSSVQIREGVEAVIGPLQPDEDITGQARTTQPGEDVETTNVRLSLPLIDVIGVATSAERADLISTTANDVFQEFVSTQQTEIGVAEDVRVVLTTLRDAQNDGGSGANAAIPVVVTFLGSMVAFIALAYLLYAGQKTSEYRRIRKAEKASRKAGKARPSDREARRMPAADGASERSGEELDGRLEDVSDPARAESRYARQG